MVASSNNQAQSLDRFHKICVVGGGLTGAFMTLLLEESNMFSAGEIAWIKPKNNTNNDFRTTFYNSKSIKLLKQSIEFLNKSIKSLSKVLNPGSAPNEAYQNVP